MALLLENLLFTVVVPGTVAVYVPVFVLRNQPSASRIESAVAAAVLAWALLFRSVAVLL